jgi:cytolysin-activating lysine-acyltransferase
MANPTKTKAATSENGGSPSTLTPELMAQIGEIRSKIQISIGQTVLAIMDLPRYKHMTVGDLSHLIINPLLRNRVAIAHKSVMENGVAKVDEETIAGIAIWATVSAAVDSKIGEQIKAGVFPIRMAPEEWTSGDLPWLLDVIAADRQQATAVLANFRQLAGDKPVKIHPMVGRLIDPAVLEKLRAASEADGKTADPAAFPPITDTKGNA